jgi:DNA-binding transcriptional LysR family regulator
MDRLKAMATFVRIIEAGSLTAAADSLDQSTASVVRSLAALEKHLGARLLNRTTRRLALTDEGAEFLAWSRHILAEFETMETRFEARQHQPAGVLRLTAPVEFGSVYVAPLITAFLKAHPAMGVELILLDRMVDLLDEGLDLAIRIGHLPDSTMIAKPLGTTRHVLCASPDFIAAAGPPSHPEALRGHPCIAFAPQGQRWGFLDQGKPLTVDIKARLVTNQIRAARLACLDGLGITRLLHYQVAQALADGQLVRLLPDFEQPDMPIQAVYPHSRLLAPRIRHFIDWAAPRLSAALPDPA